MTYHKTPIQDWHVSAYTEKEKELIISTYKSATKKGGWLILLSQQLGRPKSNISRYAKSLGLTSRVRTSIEKKCMVCGKEMTRAIYGALVYQKKTCSVKCSIVPRKGMWSRHKHPKGMLGKHHSEDYKKKCSVRLKNMWGDPKSKMNSEEFRQLKSDSMSKMMAGRSAETSYSRTTKGWVEFAGCKRYFMRSKWEMNYGAYLDWLISQKEILDWEYEVETFWFEAIRRGVRSYTPDFKVTTLKGDIEFHEVKGWMDPKSKTKLQRMKKYYPKVKVIVVDEDAYKSIKKYSTMFTGWID